MAPIPPFDSAEEAKISQPHERKPEIGRTWRAVRIAAACLAVSGAIGLFAIVANGFSSGWIAYAPDTALLAVVAMFASLIIGVATADDRGGGRDAAALLAVAVGMAVTPSVVWLAREPAIQAIEEKAAECRERKENASDFAAERAFEAGVAYHEAGCTHLPTESDKFISGPE